MDIPSNYFKTKNHKIQGIVVHILGSFDHMTGLLQMWEGHSCLLHVFMQYTSGWWVWIIDGGFSSLSDCHNHLQGYTDQDVQGIPHFTRSTVMPGCLSCLLSGLFAWLSVCPSSCWAIDFKASILMRCNVKILASFILSKCLHPGKNTVKYGTYC